MFTRKQWNAAISRIFTGKPRAVSAPSKPTNRKPQSFHFIRGDEIVETIDALTKSEARAIFKAERQLQRIPTFYRVLSKAEHLAELDRQAERAARAA